MRTEKEKNEIKNRDIEIEIDSLYLLSDYKSIIFEELERYLENRKNIKKPGAISRYIEETLRTFVFLKMLDTLSSLHTLAVDNSLMLENILKSKKK